MWYTERIARSVATPAPMLRLATSAAAINARPLQLDVRMGERSVLTARQ